MSAPRVVFVCTANTCRSAFMEIYARSLLGDRVLVSSAGTDGPGGEPVSPEMTAELESRGLDTAGFLSRRVTRAIVEEADLVLTAGRSHRRILHEQYPGAVDRISTLGEVTGWAGDPDVADPFRGGPAAAAEAAAQMAGMLDQLPHDLLQPASAQGKPLHD